MAIPYSLQAPTPEEEEEQARREAADREAAGHPFPETSPIPLDAPVDVKMPTPEDAAPLPIARIDGGVTGAPSAVPPPSELPPGAPAPDALPPPEAPPIAAVPAEKKTTHSTHQESFVKPSKEDAQVEADRKALQEKQEKQIQAETAAEKAKLQAESDAAEERRKIQAQKEIDTRAELDAYNAEVGRREAIARDEEQKYRSQMEDFYGTDPKKRFWARQDTGDKLSAGVSLVLGIFGGLKDGSNVGADRIEAAIKDDTARARDKLAAQKEILANSRADVTTAKNDIDRRTKLLDLRTATALDRAAAEAEAKGKKLGISDAELKGNEGILKLRAGALAIRQKFAEDMRHTVKNEIETTKITDTGVGKGAGDTRLKPSDKDLENVNNAATAIRGLDEAMQTIGSNPKAWSEVRRNNIDWKRAESASKIPGVGQLRAVGQGLGAVNVDPAQGLKSPDAKLVHRQVTQLRESIAKLSGGVVTESDRTGADNLLALAAVADPREAVSLLAQAKERISNGLRLTLANRQMAVPEGILPGGRAVAGTGKQAPGAAAAVRAAVPPTDGQRKRAIVKGVPVWGTVRNGHFFPDA